MSARARASGLTVAAVVTSPLPISSASARATISEISSWVTPRAYGDLHSFSHRSRGEGNLAGQAEAKDVQRLRWGTYATQDWAHHGHVRGGSAGAAGHGGRSHQD